jgi:hypothetical protein
MAETTSPAETFVASRWTKGNFFFPTRISVSPLRVSRIKPRLFGSNEESIAIGQVASVHIATGMIWSNIVIESSAGTDPLTSHGHRKADAQRIRDLIEGYQAAR